MVQITRNRVCYAFFVFFIFLTIITFPPLKIWSVLPTTEAYFNFLANERLTNIENGMVVNSSAYVVGDGHIRLSGVGGLCVDNVLDIDVKMNLFRNSSLPDASIINNAVSVDIHPAYSYEPSNSINVENPPKPFHLFLNDANNWHGSGQIVFYTSGIKAVNVTFVNAENESWLLLSPDVIQISDESVYVSKINDEYVITLSLLVVALTCLQLRTEPNVGNKAKNDKGDGKASESMVNNNNISGNKGDIYRKGRNKQTHWKHK
jgi:hypothetical protein